MERKKLFDRAFERAAETQVITSGLNLISLVWAVITGGLMIWGLLVPDGSWLFIAAVIAAWQSGRTFGTYFPDDDEDQAETN